MIEMRLNKAPKTSTERSREYRARKRLYKQQSEQQQKLDSLEKALTKENQSTAPSERRINDTRTSTERTRGASKQVGKKDALKKQYYDRIYRERHREVINQGRRERRRQHQQNVQHKHLLKRSAVPRKMVRPPACSTAEVQDIPINPGKTTNSQSLECVEDSTATTSAGQIREYPEKTSVFTRKINTPDNCMLSDTSSCSEVEPRIKRRISTSSTEQTVNNFQTISNDYTSDNEFDLFCKSLACQLKKMPLDRALICQEKLQSVMTEERLYQIGANRCEQQSEAARYEIVVKEEDLRTEEPDEYKVIVKEETDIDIDDEFV